MWKPAEKILYPAQPGRWPRADEAARARLFQPLAVGRLNLNSRTWVPAMVPWRATDDGFATDDVIAWYRRFAEGRPGALVVEATGVRDIPSGPLLRIGDDRFIPGLHRIVEAVREASGGQTKLFIQLIDFLAVRRRPDPAKFFARFLRVTEALREALGARDWPEARLREHLRTLPEDELERVLSSHDLEALRFGYRERVTDVQLPQVAELPQVLPALFAAAAQRAERVGFDGVELHYAHAYTMASFLSATNTRSDGYGGSRAARLRLPLEVYAAVRAATGTDFVVGCRALADECIKGGSGVDDASAFGVAFARAGMDFLSLSRGGKFDDAKQPAVGWAVYPYTGRSGYECMPARHSDAFGPFGRNVAATAQIRAAVRAAGFETPVVVAGGMHGFEQTEALLRSEQADIIGFARQALADPDWFEKVRTGHGDAVLVCRYSNYCEGLDQKHKQVTCELWDREARDEAGAALTADGKRRLLAPRWARDRQ
jgi:2,4-dienoyl-CoA reductase-like NADH-dependent reductase (Old Yellow Enzyme family)